MIALYQNISLKVCSVFLIDLAHLSCRVVPPQQNLAKNNNHLDENLVTSGQLDRDIIVED
jgi:hypothetical protein